MTEIWFYHLERSPLERVLPGLLEKTLARGWRAVVRAGTSERIEALDAHLWAYTDESFLPHGTEASAHPAEEPVYLTAGGERPNAPDVLLLVDRAPPPDLETELDGLTRLITVFDGADESALADARALWKKAAAAGLEASYWKQASSGKFERQQ